MDIQISCGFLPIVPPVQITESNRKNGRKLFESGHVHEITERMGLISAQVIRQTNFSKKPYSVRLTLNSSREVTSAECECIAGTVGKCKHISAVVLAINEEVSTSKTSAPCEWMKPHSSKGGQVKYAKGKKFEEMFPVPSGLKKYDPVDISYETIEHIPCMLATIVKMPGDMEEQGAAIPGERNQEVAELTRKFAAIINQQQSSQLLEELRNIPLDLKDCCFLTYNKYIHADAIEVCFETFISKRRWKSERKYRITASNCYSLFTYGQDNWQQKVDKYFNPKNFDNKFTRHGLKWEKVARSVYKQFRQLSVLEIGLVICQSHTWLGASPDGIVVDSDGTPLKLLEIKCPYQGKDLSALDVVPSCKYICADADGNFFLRKKHAYYAQVQVNMALTNLQVCDFVVFSSFDNSFVIIEVKFDLDFCKTLLFRLKKVYFCKMLHTLCNKQLQS